jgi:hypothetical protein
MAKTEKQEDQLSSPEKSKEENKQANENRAEKLDELLNGHHRAANDDGDFNHEWDAD